MMVGAATPTIPRAEWARSTPVIGDMTAILDPVDGLPKAEVALGRAIWDHTGASIGVGDSSHGGQVVSSSMWIMAASVMSDMDGDGSLELIAGNVVYERDGSILWEQTEVENGYTAIGDMSGDGLPDVVITGAGTGYILRGTDGLLLYSFALPGCDWAYTCGPPTIADFDGDNEPEIGIAGNIGYSVFEYDDVGDAWVELWGNAIDDSTSGATGSSVFDFDMDGQDEVVFADEHRLYIWNGADGVDRLAPSLPLTADWSGDHSSGTQIEYPVIADVDKDGSSEIIVASNTWGDEGVGWHGVRSIGHGAGEPWAPTRPVWNQHSYHITNVEDDSRFQRVSAPIGRPSTTFAPKTRVNAQVVGSRIL